MIDYLEAMETMRTIAYAEDWLLVGLGRQGLLAAALALLATRWLIKRRRLVAAIEELPGPPLSHRILGHLGDLSRTIGTIPTHPQLPRLMDYLQDVAKGYTDHGLFRVWVLNPYVIPFARIAIFVFDPFLARQLLTDKKITSKLIKDPRISRGLAPVTADSFFVMDDDDPLWKVHRKVAAQSFHHSILELANNIALRLLYEKVFPVWDSQLQKSQSGIAVEMVEWSTRVTLEMIGQVGFGCSFGGLSDSAVAVGDGGESKEESLYKMFRFMLTFMSRKLRSPPLVSLLWIKDRLKFRRYCRKIDSLIASIVDKRLSEAQTCDTNANADSKQKERPDLLAYLLANDRQEQRMDYRYIFGNTRMFLLAGHDSTAGALAGSLWEIAKSQTVQARLRAELDAAMEKVDTSSSLPYRDLMQLRYLDAVVKEALRLHSPAGAARMAVEDTELISEDGKRRYLIPAGAKIFSFDTVGNVNDAYFPDARQFDPERFLDERATASMANWYPFSLGPRNCVGKPLAMAELKIFVAHILLRYSLRPAENAVEPISVSTIITKPHQVLLTIDRRA